MPEINKLPKSLVEIKGEIDSVEFEKFRTPALKKLGENVEIDGFRKGHAPVAILVQKLGDAMILEEMAQLALSKHFPKILKENKIDAIGYPKINITKLALGNPLGYTITVATLPEMKLPDYKNIAKEVNGKDFSTTVTDAEFEAVLKQARTMRTKSENKGVEITPETPLLDLDDEYVKSLGGFESLEDFKKKIRDNMQEEKEWREKDKRRLQIIEGIIEKTEIDVPEVLIETELAKMTHKMKADIEGMGLKYDDYLKNLNKTEADLQSEWQKDAEKRAKLQLVVGEIAKAENLHADKATVEAEVKKVIDTYPDASPDNAHMYIESVLQNEEVFKFLEGQK